MCVLCVCVCVGVFDCREREEEDNKGTGELFSLFSLVLDPHDACKQRQTSATLPTLGHLLAALKSAAHEREGEEKEQRRERE